LAALLTVSYLLEFYWLQLAGGLYLLYLSLHHFVKKGAKASQIAPSPSFWKTVVMIEIFDLVFAVDSIIAGVAFIGPATPGVAVHPKLWIVYIGGMIGVFAIRYASRFFSTMIHRFPRLETSAYGMIGWIGLKLGIQSLSLTFPYYETLFWTVLLLIFAFGLTKKVPPPNV
jgi:YkoY family integral membrane protein